MALPAGKLRHRVELQEFIETVNSYGEREQLWGYVAKIWASVEPLSAREFITAQQLSSKVTTRITIRRREDINATMRIIFRDQAFNIEGILTDKDSGLEYMTLPCSQGLIDPTPLTEVLSGGGP